MKLFAPRLELEQNQVNLCTKNKRILQYSMQFFILVIGYRVSNFSSYREGYFSAIPKLQPKAGRNPQK